MASFLSYICEQVLSFCIISYFSMFFNQVLGLEIPSVHCRKITGGCSERKLELPLYFWKPVPMLCVSPALGNEQLRDCDKRGTEVCCHVIGHSRTRFTSSTWDNRNNVQCFKPIELFLAQSQIHLPQRALFA